MAIAADLLAAYTATAFVVFDGQEQWALHVGVASPRVDALLDRHGASRAAIATAFNPRSRALAPAANALRHDALVREIARRFEQNAVVFIERGKAPRLEFPEE